MDDAIKYHMSYKEHKRPGSLGLFHRAASAPDGKVLNKLIKNIKRYPELDLQEELTAQNNPEDKALPLHYSLMSANSNNTKLILSKIDSKLVRKQQVNF